MQSYFRTHKVSFYIIGGILFLLIIIFGRRVILRIQRNNYYNSIKSISVTIPEGFNRPQIADTLAAKLVNFNRINFLLETQNLEGKLFPDTYLFLSTNSEANVIKSMSENFEKKIAPLRPDIGVHGKTEEQVIIMASLLEKEAKGEVDREIISGILWRRVAGSMPLQVDAAPETYKTKGLPKNPICNPGLASIKAAIYIPGAHPLLPYLYYLHDKNGIAHYAKTFAEHQANIKKYLK